MKPFIKKLGAFFGIVIALGAVTACNGLSDYEKSMVGKYYNTALSDPPSNSTPTARLWCAPSVPATWYIRCRPLGRPPRIH